MSKSKRIGLVIAILLLLVAGGGIVYWYGWHTPKTTLSTSLTPAATPAITTTPQATVPATPPAAVKPPVQDAKAVISLIRSDIQANTLLSKTFIPPQTEIQDALWKGSDGWTIGVPLPATITLFANQAGNPGLPLEGSPNIDQFNTQLNSIFTKKLTSLGFTKDANNIPTSGFVSATVYCEKSSFAKDALGSFTDQNGASMYGSRADIECTNKLDFDKWHDIEIPLLSALGGKSISISGVKIKGNVARMEEGLVDQGGGGEAAMYFDKGTWKVIVSFAQAMPVCKDFADKNIPPQFWIECYDANNNIQPAGSAWNGF